MSARDRLRSCFPALTQGESNAMIERAVDMILDDHAKELADKQKRGTDLICAETVRLGHPDLAKKVRIALEAVVAIIDPDEKGPGHEDMTAVIEELKRVIADDR